MNDKFKAKFKRSYNKDNLWNKIFKAFIDMFKEEEDISIGINFKLRNGLIYYFNKKGWERFYIPKDIK